MALPKDVQFVAGTRAGTPAQNASQLGPQFDHIDILNVEVGEETETEFKITLQLTALDPPATNSAVGLRRKNEARKNTFATARYDTNSCVTCVRSTRYATPAPSRS